MVGAEVTRSHQVSAAVQTECSARKGGPRAPGVCSTRVAEAAVAGGDLVRGAGWHRWGEVYLQREQHLQKECAEHQEWKEAVSVCRAGGSGQAGNESGEVTRALGSPVDVFRGAGDTVLFVSSKSGCNVGQSKGATCLGGRLARGSWVMADRWRIRSIYLGDRADRISKRHLLHLRRCHLCFRALPQAALPRRSELHASASPSVKWG